MGAFNRRLQPKEILGLPMVGVVGLVGVLVFGVLTMMLPFVLKLITGTLLMMSAGITVAAFYLGDDLPLLPVIWTGRVVEPGRVTSETRGDR